MADGQSYMPRSIDKGAEKEENAGFQHFRIFHTMFAKAFLMRSFPKQQILDASKLKQFADDNFKFDENGINFSIWVENIVGK